MFIFLDMMLKSVNTVGIENKKQPIQKQKLKSAKDSNTI